MYIFYKYHTGVWNTGEWDIWADDDYPLFYSFTKNECHWMVPGTCDA